MVSDKDNDVKWAAVAKLVDKRDGSHCRLLRCLTPGETALLGSKASKRLDRAHIIARSSAPNLIYNVKNIVRLNRFSHTHIDNCESPLTGEPITRNERDWWWWRILNKSTEKYIDTIDYSNLVQEAMTY